MTVAVTLVTFVSLLFVGAAALLQVQIGHLKDQWYDKVEISAFLCPKNSPSPKCSAGEVKPEQIKAVKTFIESGEMKQYVAKVYFETKAEALAAFKKQMPHTAWVQALTAEQMQDSYRVKLTKPEMYAPAAERLQLLPGVEEVIDQKQQLQPIFDVINRGTILAAGIAVVMIFTALLLVPTTIRISAMSRSEEMGIMRLVGASNSFIALPFILEGIIASIIGAILAIAGIALGVKYLVQDWLGGSGSWVRIIDLWDVLWVSPMILVGALALSTLTSAITINRYLKV